MWFYVISPAKSIQLLHPVNSLYYMNSYSPFMMKALYFIIKLIFHMSLMKTLMWAHRAAWILCHVSSHTKPCLTMQVFAVQTPIQTKGYCDFLYQGTVWNRGSLSGGYSRLQFWCFCSSCNMLCFAGPHFGVPVLRTVCKDSVTIVLNESLEMTRTAPVYFWWCWHWFDPFLSCFWHRWHLLLAARKGNVKISFTQLLVVWLEW